MDFGYPRPQLQRAQWISLNGTWRFCYDDAGQLQNPAQIERWPLEITVPFPPESKASGIGDQGFHKTVWYQREVDLKPGNDRVILRFGAVDYSARVWVNGSLAATHEGGHTPFSADITHMLDPSGRQVITVRAEDDPQELTKPRGKQDWQLEPHSLWYPRTTGIWQTVWMERVPRTYVDKIRWTPRVEGFSIGFEARLGGDRAEDLSMELILRHEDRLLARDRYRVVDGEVDRSIALSDPGIDDFRNELLWSPERPTLLDATVRLMQGDRVIDEFTSYTALRSVKTLRDRFMLNGRPYVLRLVLDQGYWPDTLLASPGDDALRRDVELAKAMGFNGVRKHQKVEDPRYLYWADKLGLMVWGEMPSAYRFTRTAIKRTMREWSEVIDRDYSHPCVIVWVPFNESWGVPELTSVQSQRHAVEALYHFTKTLDATRPVIGNDGWESSATDIIGIHDYDANTEHIRQRYGAEIQPEQLFDRRRPGGRILTLDGYPHRGQPIVLTEFGGIAFQRHADPAVKKTWGYTRADTEEDFARLYEGLLRTVIHTALFSGFCYTQFADTFQEANGLLYADRTPKVPLERIKAVTSLSRTYIPGGV
ncbi:glycoside hydrolase family 2 protein [Ramlibacter tataouinensis]|uniref:Candidate b-glycosidase, Glycoside Hydrolase Family 2 n=1 Tax=Ramlibacter tataouinensis (strain ATCC BAA-407 / DSM 14655 / LMG 21543 / TTB310) TaxID=365046 RepID=F5XVK2_RAMTT|nr:glycoside hydrolase family 2 TIM barrel-domain containing protein [Ramlibacter tataouinensis]AEG91578.1 candidate b-glycosidase, Glycoside Hydrolase Family 2 [Ramlibacter tataouinensis TTB310]